MCGILCMLDTSKKNVIEEISNDHRIQLNRRGPDKCGVFVENQILLYGFVLWQQGSVPTNQPVISDKNVLLLNGDIFNSGKSELISDTTWLLNQLNHCTADEDLFKLFQNLKGPYSVIFFNKISNLLYFGRDSLGRNSLLIEKNSNILKILSCSYVSKEQFKCIELPPIGLFKINLNIADNLCLYPWKNTNLKDLENLEQFLGFKILIKEQIISNWLCIKQKPSQHYYNFYDIIHTLDKKDLFQSLLKIQSISIVVKELLDKLTNSIKDRIGTPQFCKICLTKISTNENIIGSQNNCHHSKIGILFSGGLDCTIIACIINNCLNVKESIDLINISFENYSNKEHPINWNVPDRVSAKKSYDELTELFPERKWNFVEVNVTRNELEQELNGNLKNLIYPLETVLDESLGSVFWFAARGKGILNNQPYQSNSRILFIGSGADELFGGYTRHRNSYLRTHGNQQNKLQAVEQELEIDWKRIPFRNLGRDDRVIADSGKTARCPYIEEDLVYFINNLQPEQKCCFDLEQGVGDKLLLRLCGYKLNLRYSSMLKKRAVQFGSRIANKKQNAGDISLYLKKVT